MLITSRAEKILSLLQHHNLREFGNPRTRVLLLLTHLRMELVLRQYLLSQKRLGNPLPQLQRLLPILLPLLLLSLQARHRAQHDIQPEFVLLRTIIDQQRDWYDFYVCVCDYPLPY